jgi:GTP-binding protein EngB required for normal cell division
MMAFVRGVQLCEPPQRPYRIVQRQQPCWVPWSSLLSVSPRFRRGGNRMPSTAAPSYLIRQPIYMYIMCDVQVFRRSRRPQPRHSQIDPEFESRNMSQNLVDRGRHSSQPPSSQSSRLSRRPIPSQSSKLSKQPPTLGPSRLNPFKVPGAYSLEDIDPPAYSARPGDPAADARTAKGDPSFQDDPTFVADERYFRGGFEPQESDIFIAVMGVTGSGKSTFISHCTDQKVQVGHSLQSCTRSSNPDPQRVSQLTHAGTQTVTAYLCRYSADVNVYLIDTPGFDDTHKSELDVLKEIATWLTDSFRKGIRINGILYLQRITDTKIPGSSVRSISMFQKLCGHDALKNVMLVTTMWEKVDVREGEDRVRELTSTDEFWGCMIHQGSRVDRHTNDRTSALRLVTALLHSQGITLKVQDEMVNDGKPLDETGAGIELDGFLANEREKWQREMEEIQAEYREALDAKDGKWAALIKEQENALNEKLRNIEKARETMKVSMEAMHKEKYDQLSELFEKTRQELQHLQSSKLSSVPRARSHPGKTRINEFRSFTAIDMHYYFCGPAWNEG